MSVRRGQRLACAGFVDAEGRRCPAGRGRVWPPRLRNALASVPDRRGHAGRPMARAPRVGALGGAWVVEDHYDSQYRYGSRPAKTHPRARPRWARDLCRDPSKARFPALRIGYLVLPPLVAPFCTAKWASDHQAPKLEQWALCLLLPPRRAGLILVYASLTERDPRLDATPRRHAPGVESTPFVRRLRPP